jgi:hypothetical protein
MYFHLAFKFYDMKILLPLIVFTLVSIPAFSQKQFEGTITYIIPPELSKTEMQMNVVFGKNALKLKFEEKNEINPLIMLIHLDSGKIYTLNMHDKTYGVRRLLQREISSAIPAKKEILGYAASAINIGGISPLAFMTGVFNTQESILYEADSLFYTIPEKYALNFELAFIHKGRIVLGVDIKQGKDGEWYDGVRMDAHQAENISIKVTSVKWEPISDAELSLPAGFVKREDSYTTADSSWVTKDTPYVVPAPDKMINTSKKKPVNSSKKPATPPQKTNTRPKEAIRKPE